MHNPWFKLSTLAAVGLTAAMVAGCSTTPKPSTKVVTVSQSGDSKLSCVELETEIDSIEHGVADLVKYKMQREKRTFAIGALSDLTIGLLSQGKNGAMAPIQTGLYAGYTAPEQARIESLIQRHHHLLVIAKEKQCGFADKVENQLEQTLQPAAPATPAAGARQRITE